MNPIFDGFPIFNLYHFNDHTGAMQLKKGEGNGLLL